VEPPVRHGADDFTVSDGLTSLMLAQLSERRELDQVFVDRFDREGCSIELREAAQYGAHEAGTFADIVATGSAQDHSASASAVRPPVRWWSTGRSRRR
jgi:hypothetical protein